MWPAWLASLFEEQLIVAVALSGVFLVLAVGIVAGQWRRVRLAQIEAALKQQMLDKGIPIADMQVVLRASSERRDDEETTKLMQLTGDPATDQPRLVSILLEHGYSGDDVERLLRALSAPTTDASAEQAWPQRARVLAILVENALEADEIERILSVLDHGPRPPNTTS